MLAPARRDLPAEERLRRRARVPVQAGAGPDTANDALCFHSGGATNAGIDGSAGRVNVSVSALPVESSDAEKPFGGPIAA